MCYYNMEEKSDSRHISQHHIHGGSLLISSPLLNDPNFKRSIVLILQQDPDNGYLGLVLNHQLDLSLNEICEMPGEASRMNVFNGGPVDLQRIFWLHTLGCQLQGSFEVLPGLFVGGDYDQLIQAFSKGERMKGKIRFFLGYSGWTSGQLEKEIDGGAWAVLSYPLDPKMLIEKSGEEMWYDEVRKLGEKYRHWLMLPSNPTLN